MSLSTLRDERGRCVIPPRYLRLSHWNIGGVISDAHGNKFEDSELLKAVEGEDLFAFTETQAGKDTELKLPGYVIKRKNRPKSLKAKRYSGGLALAIKEELASSVEILDSKSDNIMWAKLKCLNSDKDFLLGIVYISPMNSSYTKNVLVNQFATWEILTQELAKYKSQFRIGLVGDFNARTGALSDIIVNDDSKFMDLPDDYSPDKEILKRQNCDEVINQFGKKLIEICQMSGIRIINGRKLGDSTGKKNMP